MKGYGTFFRLWLGQTVSGLGSQLTGFGLGVWVYNKTHSVTAMAMIFMASAVPGIVLSPFIGALVDRVDRKKILLFADSFAGVFGLGLLCVLSFAQLQIWQIYVVAAAGSIANTIMWPALTATTSLLVPKEQLGRASGLLQFGEAGSYVLSPLLGGFIFAFFGLRGLVACDLASFAFAICMTTISKVPRPAATDEGEGARKNLWTEAAFGFQFILARPGLMILLAFFMFINLVMPITGTLIAPIILSHWDAKALGTLQSIAGVGMLIGTAGMASWGGPRVKVNGVWIFGVVTFLSSLLMLLPLSLFVMGASFFLMMASAPIVNTCSQAIWQRKTPADVQGKVFATRRMLAWFMTPVAFGIAGPLAEGVFEHRGHPTAWVASVMGSAPGSGYRLMFILAGVLTLIASTAVFAIPRFRHMEDEMPDAELKAAPELSIA